MTAACRNPTRMTSHDMPKTAPAFAASLLLCLTAHRHIRRTLPLLILGMHLVRGQDYGGSFSFVHNAYSYNSYCQYSSGYCDSLQYITLDNGYSVSLALDQLSLTTNISTCAEDHVKVYNGHSAEDAALLGTYCAIHGRLVLESSSNRMLLVFHVHQSNYATASGQYFATNGSAVCGNLVVSTTTTLQAPQDASWTRCVYWVSTPNGYPYLYTWNFTDSLLPGDCGSTYLTVKNIYGLSTYCSDIPASISYVDYVQLVIGDVTQTSSLRFNVTVTKTLDCGSGVLTGSESSFSSSVSNPDHMEGSCSLYITVDSGYRVLLMMDSLLPNATGDCSTQYVKVYNGPAVDEAQILATYCTFAQNLTLEAPSSQVVIEHYTSGSSESIALNGWFYTSSGSDVCGSPVLGDGSVLQSPGYPNPYPTNVRCAYWIPGGGRLTFTDFNLPFLSTYHYYYPYHQYPYYYQNYGGYYTYSCQDYVTTENQYTYGSQTLCNTVNHPSAGLTAIKVKFFSSDSTTPGVTYGFRATVNTGIDCQGASNMLVATEENFNFYVSNPERRAGNCSYRITSTVYGAVLMKVDSLNLGVSQQPLSGNDCSTATDYVQVYSGHANDQANLLRTYCGNAVLQYGFDLTESTSNQMLVEYVTTGSGSSDFSVSGQFSGTSGSSVCGNATVTFGRVMQPSSYPSSYPTAARCLYILPLYIMGSNYLHHLHFTNFNLPTEDGYCSNQIEVYSNGYGLQRFCAGDVPPATVADVYKVVFTSSQTLPASGDVYGFQAEYTVSLSCGNTAWSGNDGSFGISVSNPRYIKGGCNYYFTVDSGYRALLLFDSLLQNATLDCSADYVKVYDGSAVNETQLIATYCSSTQNIALEAPSSQVVIAYYTSGTSQSLSITGSFSCTSGSDVCGSALLGDGSILQSPGYPNAYPTNVRCAYWIPGGGRLTFQDFNLPYVTNYRYHYYYYYYNYYEPYYTCLDYVSVSVPFTAAPSE